MRRPFRPEAERARLEVGLEDRFDHRLQGRLNDPVAHRWDRQRPPLRSAGLRDQDPARRKRTVAAALEVRGQLVDRRSAPCCSTCARVTRSMPAAPRLARTCPATLRRFSAAAGPGRASPSSRRHPLSVPRPLCREVPRGCTSRLFTPSVAFAVTDAARLPSARQSRAQQRRGRLRFDATDPTSRPPPRRAFEGERHTCRVLCLLVKIDLLRFQRRSGLTSGLSWCDRSRTPPSPARFRSGFGLLDLK